MIETVDNRVLSIGANALEQLVWDAIIAFLFAICYSDMLK